jgi:hypothetical protein
MPGLPDGDTIVPFVNCSCHARALELYVRGVAMVYLVASASLAPQMDGLVGEEVGSDDIDDFSNMIISFLRIL